MQKKILLTLLMSTPATLPLLADINLGNPNTWVPSGLAGDEYQLTDNNTFSAALGTGILRQNVNLPKGKYTISFKSAVNIKVTVNGKELQDWTATALKGSFVMESDGNALIEVTGKDQTRPYSFEKSMLTLDFDFVAAGQAIQMAIKDLNSVATINPAALDIVPGAKELQTEGETLEAKKNNWQEVIMSLLDDQTSSTELFKLYKELGLSNDEASTWGVMKEITGYNDEIKTHNDKVAEVNATYQRYLDQKAAKAALLEDANQLKTITDKLVADATTLDANSSEAAFKASVDLPSYQAFQQKVNDYIASINEAYADDKLLTEITFDSQSKVLRAEYDQLNDKYKANLADWNAYNKYMNVLVPLLQNTYTDDTNTLDGVQGVKNFNGNDFTDTFYDIVDPAKAKLTEIFNAAKNNLTISSIVGAAAKIEANEKTVNDAVAEMNAATKVVTDKATEQNTNIGEADETIFTGENSIQNRYDKIIKDAGTVIPSQFVDQFNQFKQDYATKLKALTDFVENRYGAPNHNLPAINGDEVELDYLDLYDDLEVLLSNFKKFIEPFAPINALQKALDDAKAYIKAESDKLKKTNQDIDIESLFTNTDGTFESIQKAITALTGVPTDTQTKDITDAINNAKTTADNLVTAFTTLLNNNAALVKDLEAFKKFVNAKVELDGEGNEIAAASSELKKTYLDENGESAYAELAQAQKAFYQQILDLFKGDVNPQKCYDEAVKLSKDDHAQWKEDLTAAKVAFAEKLTDANKRILDNILAATKTASEEGKYMGQNGIIFGIQKNIQPLVDQVATDIRTAKANDDVTALGKADKTIEEIIAKIKDVNAQIKLLKDNESNYQTLAALASTLQDKIDALRVQNDTYSQDNGKEYFVVVINGLQSTLVAVNQELQQAYETDYADPKKNVTALFDTLQGRYAALAIRIQNTANDIEANNLNHNQQLAMADKVRVTIDDVISILKTGEASVAQDWIKAIEQLRDVDFFNNNVAVANAYGKGESAAQNTTIMNEYERILDLVKGYLLDFKGDKYQQAVNTANADTESACGWAGVLSNLQNTYLTSVEAYNAYFYGLTNPGWKAYVIDVISRHKDIYDYSALITKLTNDVNKWVQDQNTAKHVFTADEFKAVANNIAEGYMTAMNQKVAAMNAQATEAAQTYYTQLNGEADTQISGYEQKLTDAGIPVDAPEAKELTGRRGTLTLAQDMYAAASTEEAQAKTPLGLAMDRIADQLDAALVPVDLQPIAETYWKFEYGNATGRKLDGYKGGEIYNLWSQMIRTKYCPAELLEKNKAAFQEEAAKVAPLNEEVQGVSEGLIDVYKGYQDQLNAILDNLRNLRNEVVEASQNNIQNQNAYKDYVNTVIPGLNDQYQTLVDYRESLAGAGAKSISIALDAIKADIDAFAEYVENNSGNLIDADNKAWLDNKQAAILAAIDGSYGDIKYAEQQFLGSQLINMVRVAFNDAKAAYMGAEGTVSKIEKGEAGDKQFVDWNNELDAIQSTTTPATGLIPDLAVLIGDIEKNGEFQTKAQDIEKSLYDLYATFETSWTSDAHDGTEPDVAPLKALNDKYAEIAGQIADANAALEGCLDEVKTQYPDAYKALSEELDALKQEWGNIGNRVIGMQDTYMGNLDAIQEAVAAKAAEIAAADQAAREHAAKVAANEQAYKDLNARYEQLMTRYAEVEKVFNEYDLMGSTLGTQLKWVKGEIEKAKADLDERYANTELTAESTLLNAERIPTYLDNLELLANKDKATTEANAAGQALMKANDVMSGHLVPEVRAELKNKLDALWQRYDAIKEKLTATDTDIETMRGIIPEAQAICEAAEALEGEISENLYVPGDVNLNPDGEVTVADVMQLLKWVGEGMTFEELVAQNPRQAYAADLNEDQELNMTDVAMDIALALGENVNTLRVNRFAAPAASTANALNVQLISDENGVKRYAVTLDNTVGMVAGQIDLKVPSGMNVTSVKTTDRAAELTADVYDRDFDNLRVLLYSMDNKVIETGTGAVLIIEAEGSGNITAENVIFTDNSYRTVRIEKPGSSMIDSIIDGAKEIGQKIYNAAGVAFDNMQRGINIIRHSNGKTTKEYNKK